MSVVQRLHRLDDRALGWMNPKTERSARTYGITLLMIGLVLMTLDTMSEVSIPGGVLMFGLAAGLFLGRSTEAKARRLGRFALIDDRAPRR